MNILFISTNYPYPPDSGHNLRTYNILKLLAEDNNIFLLAFTKKKSDFINDNDPIKKMCKSIDLFKAPDDLSKLRMLLSLFSNLFSRYPYIAEKYYRTDVKERIKSIIKNNKIDLIHIDILHLSRYIDDINFLPKALTEHNIESLRVLRIFRNSKNLFLKIYMYIQYEKLYYFEKITCPKFDICITVSKDDLNVLNKMSPKSKLIAIPNGVDTTYFQPNSCEPEPNSLIWVGGMHDIYNREAVDFFCNQIFPEIEKEIRDVKFIVIGDRPSKSLINLSKKYKNVRILGYVEDIRPYIHSATVFIAPLKSGGGTKFKVLNALAMGKPVVTTTIGAEGIEVKDNENIIIADNPKTFARKTIELLREPERAKAIGKQGRKLIIEKYDWNVIGTLQNNIYKKIMVRI